MQNYLGMLLTGFALWAKCFQGQSEHVDSRAQGQPALKQAPKHACGSAHPTDLICGAAQGPHIALGQRGRGLLLVESTGTHISPVDAAGPLPSAFHLVLKGSLTSSFGSGIPPSALDGCCGNIVWSPEPGWEGWCWSTAH